MNSKEKAIALDKKDTLQLFKKEFVHAENEIYFDGNSLGKLTIAAGKELTNAIENQWGKNLIRSWNDHWLSLNQRIATQLGRLLNAKENEILIGDSTSVNLYKIIFSLMASEKYPNQLLTDELNFPTDNYILQGIEKHFKAPKTLCLAYPNTTEAKLETIEKALEENPGILCLSLVTYKSAYLYPMKRLNQWAKKNNSIIVWDLSHAVGAVHINFEETQTLAAVGCTYKYLNGGPGSPAFLYVNKAIISHLNSPIQGWFGHANPFTFSSEYQAAEGIEKFKAGTPSILSLVALEHSLSITLKAGTKEIQEKSKGLSQFMLDEIERELLPLNYYIESPRDTQKRGSHLSLSHPEGWRICKALLEGNNKGVKIIPDFRPPHFIRFGIAPLYIGFEDVYLTVQRLKAIVIDSEFTKHSQQRPKVT